MLGRMCMRQSPLKLLQKCLRSFFSLEEWFYWHNGEGHAFEDGEDVVYNQGYDWIHDSASVMYEDENGEGGYVEYVSWDESEDGGQGGWEDDEDDDDFNDYDDVNQDVMMMQGRDMPRKSLRELRAQADEMERRGEL